MSAIWSVFELWRESDINVESFGYNNGFGLIGNKILYESENTTEKIVFFMLLTNDKTYSDYDVEGFLNHHRTGY
jgi:hypothetical protein